MSELRSNHDLQQTRVGTPPTSKQHQPEAPVGVSQRAASQQDLLIVQRVFLTGVG